jgi:hypothetical protein
LSYNRTRYDPDGDRKHARTELATDNDLNAHGVSFAWRVPRISPPGAILMKCDG